MAGLSPRTLEIVDACFADDGQRSEILSRLEREIDQSERVRISVIRTVFEHHDRDWVDYAFHVARRDWRDALMVAGHGRDLEALDEWAERMLRERPRVTIRKPETLELRVDERGWGRCPSCGFRFDASARDHWFNDRHQRCMQPLRVVEEDETEPVGV